MTYFSKRVEKVEDGLSFFGVLVPDRDALFAADESVEQQVRDLYEAAGVSALDDASLSQMGRKIAAGELKVKTVLDRIGSAGNLRRGDRPSRLGIVAEGVRQGAREGLDRPGWSLRGLREACVPGARQVVEQAAVELVESWRGLPEWLRTAVASDRMPMPMDVMRHVQVESISGVDLEAARRCSAVWGRWSEHAPDGAVRSDAFAFLGLGRELRQSGAWHRTNEERPLEYALLFTDRAAEVGAGLRVEDLVMGSRGAVAVDALDPIADPFGEDAVEYGERLAVFDRVVSWRQDLSGEATPAVTDVVGLPRRKREEMHRRRGLKPRQVLSEMAGEGLL